MSKFVKLYESAIQRFTRGGFLTGDLVKFKQGYQDDEFFGKQASNYLQKLEEFVKSGLNIRVSAVKSTYPSSFKPGNVQNEAESFLVDIVLEQAPGLYYQFITVPAHVLEHIDTGINLAPVPDGLKYDNKVQAEPVPANVPDTDSYQSPYRQTRTTDIGNARDNRTELQTPIANVKIPSSPVEGDRDPAVSSGTARYLPANNRRSSNNRRR